MITDTPIQKMRKVTHGGPWFFGRWHPLISTWQKVLISGPAMVAASSEFWVWQPSTAQRPLTKWHWRRRCSQIEPSQTHTYQQQQCSMNYELYVYYIYICYMLYVICVYEYMCNIHRERDRGWILKFWPSPKLTFYEIPQINPRMLQIELVSYSRQQKIQKQTKRKNHQRTNEITHLSY